MRDAAGHASPQRYYQERYDRNSYGLAIERPKTRRSRLKVAWLDRTTRTMRRGGGRLTEPEREAVKAWRKEHRWHPNQLRHSFATRVRKHHGLEAAQVLLGHSRADVTQVYAERNDELAAKVAAKIG
jgi:hypothetical protein